MFEGSECRLNFLIFGKIVARFHKKLFFLLWSSQR